MNRPEPHTSEFLLVSDGNLEISGLSDVGLVRQRNEDSFLFADLTEQRPYTASTRESVHIHARPSLLVVADGVGGAASGNIASSLATLAIFDQLREAHESGALRGTVAIADMLKMATEAANREILAFARDNPKHKGMATTATVALVMGDQAYFAQVGDSRAYVVRGGVARQLTKDQSLVQRLIDAGRLTPAQAAQSEHRNIILQALGPEESVVPELTRDKLKTGDVLVVCSDGLSNQVEASRIARMAGDQSDVAQLCANLVGRARETGAPDNVTVLAARFWRDRDML
ncbi:MAG: serine/threonine-protein phosphatase [Gemmatimonadaceae bacterium]|nr:serine/threonine-protein phosphatase [Gemmatimonadaceae bacterium]